MLIKNLFYFLSLMLLLGGQNAFAQFDFTVTAIPESCPNNGALDFAVTGADPAATVTFSVWKNTASPSSAIITTNPNLTGLDAGVYNVQGSHSVGANTTTLLKVSEIINTENVLDFRLTAIDPICTNTGQITVTVTSGVAESYSIASGPVTRPSQASNIFSGLPAGNYLVNVTNALCIGAARSKSVSLLLPDTNFAVLQQSWGDADSLPRCDIFLSRSVNLKTGTVLPYTLMWVYTEPGNTVADTVTVLYTRTGEQITNKGTLPIFYRYPYEIKQLIFDGCNVLKDSSTFIAKDSIMSIYKYEQAANNTSCTNLEYYLEIIPRSRTYSPPFTLEFISYPAGFDPLLLNPTYQAPSYYSVQFGSNTSPVPVGTYVFTITDSCGRVGTFERRIYNTKIPFNFTERANETCDPNEATLFYRFNISDNVQNLERIEVVEISDSTAQAEFESRYGPLPYNFNHLFDTSSNGTTTACVLFLPTGGKYNTSYSSFTTYKLDLYSECGTKTTRNVNVKGYVPSSDVLIEEYCTTFDITTPPVARMGIYTQNAVGTLPQPASYLPINTYYFLQKYDPIIDEWVHPETNVVYDPISQNLKTGGMSLNMNATTANLQYKGTMRIIFAYNALYAGGAEGANITCITELNKFTINSKIDMQASVVQCDETSVNIIFSTDTKHGPCTYSIIEKDGVPYNLSNGTNPLFQNLDLGIYKFQITDTCQNQSTNTIDASMIPLPPITALNLCDGDTAALSVNFIPNYSYSWVNMSDTTIELSDSNVLVFENFYYANDAGTYRVTISPSDPTCSSTSITYSIPGQLTPPNAGEGLSGIICGASERGFVNLFEYLSGDYDNYGNWTEHTTSGTLTGSVWDNNDVDPGIYIFEYTVPGSSCAPEASTLVVFQIDIDCTPLNVDFTNFNVRKMGTSGHLNWKVASEKSTKGYYVEKSLDGQQWATLNFVPSQAPNGVSSNSLEYQFVDKTLQKGYNFYRIKHMDWEGKHKYSPIKYLEVGTINAIVIHPNPAVDVINIKGLSEGNLVMIHNIVGKKMHESTANAASVQINTQQFQSGVYVLTIIDAQGISSTHKIVIKD